MMSLGCNTPHTASKLTPGGGARTPILFGSRGMNPRNRGGCPGTQLEMKGHPRRDRRTTQMISWCMAPRVAAPWHSSFQARFGKVSGPGHCTVPRHLSAVCRAGGDCSETHNKSAPLSLKPPNKPSNPVSYNSMSWSYGDLFCVCMHRLFCAPARARARGCVCVVLVVPYFVPLRRILRKQERLVSNVRCVCVGAPHTQRGALDGTPKCLSGALERPEGAPDGPEDAP